MSSTKAQFQPHRCKEMVSFSSLVSSAEEEGSDTTYYHRGFHAQVTRQLQEDAPNCWSKVGADIDGEFAGDTSFGVSVAVTANGSRVISGAPFNDDNGENSRHAQVFEYDGSNWNKIIGEDIDREAEGDQSGWAVAITADGSRVIIGAAGNDGNGENFGHARVFEFDGSNWNKLGSDIDGEAGDRSGHY
jgi:hypothetical protein